MIPDTDTLRILICIGGGPEAYTGLRYAARLGKTTCPDIDLLYVRSQDSGLQSGGLEVRVARENMLDWGLELPGLQQLKKARDILVELGEITPDADRDWKHLAISGDPAGEYVREYENPCGGRVSLRLRTGLDVISLVTDEADRCKADLVIVGASPEPRKGLRKYLSPKPMALQIAAHAKQSVILARHLERGHGHLICVEDTDRSRAMLDDCVRYVKACQCDVSILSVAPTEADLDSARKATEEAAQRFRENDIQPHEIMVETGDPVDTIITVGYDYSLIMLAESQKPWFSKTPCVPHQVAEHARNSVMIVK